MNGEIPVILIVDDVRTNLLILKTILQKEGFHVLEAANGASAREIAIRQTPDLILLDIMMPEEDGFETCIKLKSNSVTAAIPVLFISALSEIDKKVKGFGVGAVDYITKPFENAEVLARTKLHLRLSNARKSLIESQSSRLKQLTKAQQGILVKSEDLPEARFAVKYLPVLEAGGDFYDVISFSEDIFGYFCADVSGHDLGSSLATSAFKALIHQNAGLLYSPEETLQIVNSVLGTVLGADIYLTAVYVMVNRLKKEIKIVSAGHPPVLYLPIDEKPFPVDVVGDVIGMFDNIVLEVKKLKVKRGDRFFLYTDGIIEEDATGKISRASGIQRLSTEIEKTGDISLESSVDNIIASLYNSGKTANDDIVLLGVEI